ncbi:MAG: hypothetical protein VYD85_04370 [Pseudomonadota bacterium]|nr:hypothetical protein [Pseudomonadota bacterium]
METVILKAHSSRKRFRLRMPVLKCGKCFDVCPMAPPAGLEDAAPEHVLTGVLDICELGTAMRKGAAGRKSAATAGFALMPAIMASIRD